MKLIYRITLSFAIPLVITLGLWGWFSFRTMERKIHADTDLILKEYSDDIIMRKLSGSELPERFNGAYNTYYIKEVPPGYAAENPPVSYEETEAFIRSQEDFASSRIRRQIFMDRDGQYYEIGVSLPTFEQDVLVGHVLWWTVLLFVVLLISLLVIGFTVLRFSMRPLDALLKWMDEYVPGIDMRPVPDDSDIIEFRRLAAAANRAVGRFEKEYEERRIFIGNASHELQTPLAVCSNRIELLLERPDLEPEMAEELVKLHRDLGHLIRLNKTLLLLTRIENGQFPEMSEVNLSELFADSLALNGEIYSYKGIISSFDAVNSLVVSMNAQMASVLVNNLVKNAYVHSPIGGNVDVRVTSYGFVIRNTGDSPLDESGLYRRFYQHGGRKEGSVGLGLALAYSVCERSGLELSYKFDENRHVFSVNFKKSK
ncbi:MAG: HAMP domain-containing histidine kinase [Bacteroidales bacterium]|nr:HAMP domain-containing histidine kinase [Bacteroidales bacterium]